MIEYQVILSFIFPRLWYIIFQCTKTLGTIQQNPSLVFNFFIPTSGWNEIDRFGRFSVNWRLREQQVDSIVILNIGNN